MTESEKPAEPSDALLREAQGWVVRLHSGQVSQADIAAVTHWRMTSQAHRRAFAEANMRWGAMQTAARTLAETGDPACLFPEAARPERRLTRRALLGGAGAVAASVVLCLAAGRPAGRWLSERSADYRTDTGEQRRIALPGGGAVEMNTQTSLAVSPAGVELIDGEIAVTASGAPLVVTAGDGRISAGQAVFNLRYDDRKVSVVCFDGEVRVECRGRSATLPAGRHIAYDKRGLSSAGATDPDTAGAWRRGLLIFENEPLSRVVEEINRYRRGRIVLVNGDLGRLPLDATFRLDRIDEAVPKIARVFGVKVRSLPGGLVLLS